MTRVVLLAVLAAGLFVPSLAADDKSDKIARDAVEAFMKALKAEDMDALMKAVDVPWFHDKKKLVKDKDELKQLFQMAFDKQDLTGLTYEIKATHEFSKVREHLDGEQLEWATEAAGKTAVILKVEVVHGSEMPTLHVLVRLKDGKATVTGFGR